MACFDNADNANFYSTSSASEELDTYPFPSCFNNADNANFHSTSSASEELDTYPFLSRTSSGEGVDDETFGTFAHGWGMVGQSEPMVGPPTGSQATANYGKYHYDKFVVGYLTRVSAEPVASASSCATKVNDYGQPTYFDHHLPTVGRQAQSQDPGLLNWDPFASMMGSEPSTMVPAPNSGKNLLLWNSGGIEY
jgi:hypothetical protein